MGLFKIIEKFRAMPGNYKTTNVFDTLFGGVTLGLVEGLGSAVNLLESIGFSANKRWKPGEKLEILFLTYSGASNTGADVRIAECINQMNKILGEENVSLNMTTLDVDKATEYLSDSKVNLKPLSSVFFSDVFNYVLENHLIVLAEGTAWKENFAAALLLYFLYGIGLTSKFDKVSFSYAVDAGEMNKINNFLSWYLSKDMTKIITRSSESTEQLNAISLPGSVQRVDTSWVYKANSLSWAKKVFKSKGWDGKKPLIGIAMQNYFRWPVIPDLLQYGKSLLTGDMKNQYSQIYYYDYSKADEEEFHKFAQNIARALDQAVEEFDAQPVLIGMEALDKEACEYLASVMKSEPIMCVCQDYNGHEMAALLRVLSLLIVTRYHAMILSMPGLTPIIGLSRDERIRGVMKETGLYDDYYLSHTTPDLEKQLIKMIQKIMTEGEAKRIENVIKEQLPYYYAQLGMLGLDIRNLITSSFPGITIKNLNEDDLMDLIPYCPKEYIEESQKKFLELKQKST